ncbi:YHS domain-containing (seleno)protein [Thermohalobaculum xanthum]|nr:YHS domain-containing (seleno)protein [Thermohalobaculum xanthum]
MPSIHRRHFMTALGGAIALGAGGVTLARALMGPAPVPPAAVFAENGVAIRGADPVAYFTEGRAVIGSAEYALDWQGAEWHFASAANRDAFRADPLAYAPQYGGFCAWAVAAKAELYSTQPTNWAIVDGKLYLNFNDDIQARWSTDIPGFIAAADRNWADIGAGGRG